MNPIPFPVSFPEELKLWIWSSNTTKVQFQNVLSNAVTCQQFETWAANHPLFVDNSPLMQRIVKAIGNTDTLFADDISIEDRITEVAKDHFCYKIEKENFNITGCVTAGEVKQNLSFICEYFDIGLINADYVVQLLVTCFQKDSFIHEWEYFEQILPLLEKLPFEHTYYLLTATNETGNTPLHLTKNFVASLTFLKKLSLPEFKRVLAIPNKAGTPLLFNPTVFPMVMKYLIKERQYSSKQVVETLSLFDQTGKTVLHYYDNCIAAFSTLKKIPLPVVVKLLALTDASGVSVINDPAVYKFVKDRMETLVDGYKARPKNPISYQNEPLGSAFFLALKQLPLPLVGDMLSVFDSSGNSPLNFKDNFTSFLKFFGDLEMSDLITIYAILDVSKTPAIHYREIFPIVLSHMMNRDYCAFDLLSLLSISEKNQGRSALHLRNNFQSALPLLETLSFSNLIEILSITDSSGTAVVHASGIFPILLPHIKKHLKHMHQILQIKDIKQHALLENEENCSVFNDLLAELSIEDVFEICSTPDVDGLPLLHYPKVFCSIMPHLLTCIEKNSCSIEQFERFLCVCHKNGKTLFEDSRQELVNILSIKDSFGYTIFSRKAAFQSIFSFMVNTLKYTPERICYVISCCSDEAFQYPENFERLLQYLKTIPFDQQLEFFSITKKNGLSLMHCHETFTLALPFCIQELQLTPEQLRMVLSITAMERKDDDSDDDEIVTPLYYSSNLELFLPYLKTIPINQHLQFFSIKGIENTNWIDSNELFAIVFPFLVHELKYTPEQVHAVLSVFGTDDSKETPLNDEDNFEVFFPYFMSLPIDQQIAFSSLKLNDYCKVIHNWNYFKKILEAIIETSHYTIEQLIKFVSIPDHEGNTPLHYLHRFREFLPFLKTIPVDNHKDFFSLQGKDQELVLFRNFGILIPFLVDALHYTPEQLITVLSLKDKRGSPPLCYAVHFHSFLPYLHRMSFEQQFQILSIQDGSGNPCVYYPAIFAIATSNRLIPVNYLKRVLALTTASGNTLLHYAPIRQLAQSFIYSHQIPLHEYVNAKSGLSAWDICTTHISLSWLTRPKTAEFLRQEIKKDDYKRRVDALQSRFETLWNEVQIHFDKGELSQNILFTEGTYYHPYDIKNCLLEMIKLMENQEAWLGTPPASKREQLHRFYCTQLACFEAIIQELEKRNSPSATAGHLTDIAKVRIQGRCASAYQGELEQKRTLLAGQVQGINEIIAQGAATALRSLINDIVRTDFANDVHASNQLHFAAGLAEQPDSLAPFGLIDAQRLLIHKFDPLNFYQNFEQQITDELAHDVLGLYTPDDFGPEYRALYKNIKEDEEAILQEFKACVMRCVPAQPGEKLFSLLVEMRAPFCAPSTQKNAEKETLLSQIFKRYPFITLSGETSLSSAEIKEHISKDIEDYKKTLERDATFPKKFREVHDAKAEVFSEVDAAFKFLEIMQTNLVPLEKRYTLLQAKLVCQSHLDILGEDILPLQGITYSRSAHGLPSRACESARRLAWVQSFAGKRGKIDEYILFHMGVIEKRAY
jgi:hypothetical protein